MWYHIGGDVCEFCPKASHNTVVNNIVNSNEMEGIMLHNASNT